MTFTRKLQTQNPNKIANCPPATMLQINEYGVAATTVIMKSKMDLKLLLPKQREEL